MLAVSGRLDRRLFGLSVPVYLNRFQDGERAPKINFITSRSPRCGQADRRISVEEYFLPRSWMVF